jgi:lysophospholipid acyltransferase (LPLAT)-like uncharacterized protein
VPEFHSEDVRATSARRGVCSAKSAGKASEPSRVEGCSQSRDRACMDGEHGPQAHRAAATLRRIESPVSVTHEPVSADTNPASPEGPEAARSGRRGPLRKLFKRVRRRIGLHLVSACGPFVLGRLARTWKMEVIGEEHLDRALGESRGHFMSLWHGRMVLGLPHHGKRDWHVLVSPSADGDISQRLLEGFDYAVIRGSSSRGGARALREMLTVLERGSVLIITPDGPRGPRHSMNPGLAWMARATGYPIVPIGFGVDRAWRLRSWDRFTIPKPGARIVMIYGEPVHVDRGGGTEELERATRRVQEGMLEAERRAFAVLGAAVDW